MARRRPENLTVEQEKFARMEANGYSSADIIMELWGMKRSDDPKAYHNLECKLSDWRKHPKYDQVWKDELKSQNYGDLSEALKVLRKGLQSKDGWLAMQSAINLISNASKRIYAGEESAVTVKIEGMPDLGTPDQE